MKFSEGVARTMDNEQLLHLGTDLNPTSQILILIRIRILDTGSVFLFFRSCEVHIFYISL